MSTIDEIVPGVKNGDIGDQEDFTMILSQMDASKEEIHAKLHRLDLALSTARETNILTAKEIASLTKEIYEVTFQLKACDDKIKEQDVVISHLNATIRTQDALIATTIIANQAAVLVKLDLLLERH
jgi:septal ring factor EnvC (AmiA/AmiB activator)